MISGGKYACSHMIIDMYVCEGVSTYQLKEALRSGIVVPPFISQVDFTHLIHTAMDVCHEMTNRLTYLRLQCKKE